MIRRFAARTLRPAATGSPSNLDPILLLQAAVMGVVEGLTEFLPISSTGHLILTAALIDFHGEKAKVFDIAIQTGAMLSVVWEYRRRLGLAVAGCTSDASAQRFQIGRAHV